MNFLEKDLEDIIYDSLKEDTVFGIENPNREKLFKRGFPRLNFYGNARILRQPNFGVYGRPDLVHVNQDKHPQKDLYFLDINVFELKRGELKVEHLMQLSKYLTAVKRLLSKLGIYNADVKGYLIGQNILDTSWVFLYDYLMPDVNVYTYSYELDGIGFTKEYGWYSKGETAIDLKSMGIDFRHLINLRNYGI